MNRPLLVTALLTATLIAPTIAAATPAQDLGRAYTQFDNHQWRAALALANAYLAANGRNYSAELIVAGSSCKLHPHLKSNAAPFQQLRADYSLPPQQERAVRDWIDICTSPPPQPQPQEAGVSVSGLTAEPNTRVADPNSAAPPLRHPPQKPQVVAHPAVTAGPATSNPAACRALEQVRQNPSGRAATIAALTTVCNRELQPVAPVAVPVPPPDAALPPEVEAANAERRRRYLAAACREPYVWRGAFGGDRVCVEPQVRDDAAADNARAAERRDPTGPYGPMTCINGYVWRAAREGDTVCVVPQRRDQAAADNAAAASRRAVAGVPVSG
nr:hypothetical protein [Polymorphobacter sp.]